MRELDDLDDLGQTALTPFERFTAEAAEVIELQLAVIGSGTFERYPLRKPSTVVIGRSPRCDIALDDESISRRHAELSIGDAASIIDLGSANGTRVRGVLLEPGVPARLSIGELVSLGNISLIVQPRAATPHRALWPTDAFDLRLDKACSDRALPRFGLLQLDVDLPRAGELEDALDTILRDADIACARGGGTYQVLLLDTPPDKTEAVSRRIERALIDRGIQARVRRVSWPLDGGTRAELQSQLGQRARVSRAAPVDAANIVIAAPQMQALLRLVEQVADSRIGVLLLGETGVGKEVFARAIHQASSRASGPFVEINCAALTETLLESELFGHEKGAFTSATTTKQGLIETAVGGTMLLDEIGEMPTSTQVKLLRVIEDLQLRRVGGLKPRPIDVRFIAATNVDLEAQIKLGKFRSDLFYRLNGVTFEIPPLRDRIEEIEPLALTFIRRACVAGRPVPELAPDAVAQLKRYPWPGNVRELKHVIERAVLVCGAGPIRPEHVAVDRRPSELSVATPLAASTRSATTFPKGSEDEQRWILEALHAANGNQTVAARNLKISRRTLVSRLAEYNKRPKPTKG